MFIPCESDNSTEETVFSETAAVNPLDTYSALEEERSEKDQFRNLLQRVQADFVNYKRRIEEERMERQGHANSSLLLKLLPVLDDLERASQNIPESQIDQPWVDGVDLVRRKLETLLESEGVSRIEVEKQLFDPSEHEALLYQESVDHSNNQIISAIRTGYKLHDKILRPAQVIVAKNEQEESDSADITEREE